VSSPADLALRSILILAVALLALEMALSSRYGFHRDELYFLDCARHLQGGYVDQPIMVPLLARISLWLFGVSLSGLRVWAALSVAVTVVLAALLARELGGGARAQILAALSTATMPVLLGVGDLLEPTTLDIMFWTALALVVVRIGRTGDCRYWIAGGVVLGLGLATKHSIGFFAAAVVVGALLSGGWRLIFNRWALVGAAIAICFAIPDLWWQALHNWPTLAMTQTLNQENGGVANIGTWLVGQLLMVCIALIWLWVLGIRFLWGSGRPLWRALAWAFALLFVLFAVTTGAKIYYLAAGYVYLLAAGAVSIERWWMVYRIRSILILAATAILTVVAMPLVLPVLPAKDAGVSAALAEQVGWPELDRTVARVWFSLPARQRAQAVIFTGDYGEAGAISELGRRDGLPTAVSGHNNEWFWGPGNRRATTVVAVQPGPEDVSEAQATAYLLRYFTHVRIAATLRNSAGVHNQEWDGHVYLCTGLRRPWVRTWPELRQYS